MNTHEAVTGVLPSSSSADKKGLFKLNPTFLTINEEGVLFVNFGSGPIALETMR